MTEVLGDAPADVVENGAPLARPWWALVAVLVVAAAAVGVTRARHDGTPSASASPAPSVSLVPLETVDPLPDPIGNLVAPAVFVDAPQADASQAMTLTVLRTASVVRIGTADDAQETLLELDGERSFRNVVPTRDGFVYLVEPDPNAPIGAPTDLVFRSSHGTTRLRVTADSYLVPGDGDVWVATSGAVRRYSPDGRPLGEAIRLPGDDGYSLWRATADGRLLITPMDSAVVMSWRPGGRPRTLRQDAVTIAATPTHVAFGDVECFNGQGDTCRVHVMDLATGGEWSSPVPRGRMPSTGEISRDGKTLAYVTDAENEGGVVIARRGEAPRVLAKAPGGTGFQTAWASDGRLLVVEQDYDSVWAAYAWDGRGLVRLGVYDLTDVGRVLPG